MPFNPGEEAFLRVLKMRSKSAYLSEAVEKFLETEGAGGRPSRTANGTFDDESVR